jgi:hypothetical protein
MHDSALDLKVTTALSANGVSTPEHPLPSQHICNRGTALQGAPKLITALPAKYPNTKYSSPCHNIATNHITKYAELQIGPPSKN